MLELRTYPSRYSRRKSAVRPISPRDARFTEEVLLPLVRRRAAGESDEQLSLELYDIIHGWAMSVGRSQSANLPAHADRDEVLSNALRLAWESCTRIDWSRTESWLAFLEAKVSRAGAEAARTDDWLSRRERVRRRQYQAEVLRFEQAERRSVTPAEREAIARSVAPSSDRVDWTQVVLAARHPSSVGEVPDTVDLRGVEDQVEERTIGGLRDRCLLEWLKMVAQQDERLAGDLASWSASHESPDRSLPARLATRIEPYTPLLLAMLADAA